VELEYSGYVMSLNLGLQQDKDKWIGAQDCFDIIEHFFNLAFVSELCVRLLLDGLSIFRNYSNIFDAMIVIAGCIDTYIFKTLDFDLGADLSFAKIARLFKIIKMSKAFRAAAGVQDLRILVITIVASMLSLTWSALLLGVIILCNGLVMAQMLTSMIENEALDYDFRVWAYKHYGSGTRASYTMFEATLSGGWPKYARPLIEEGGVGFAFFWVTYVLLVVFAVIKIIAALFLKKTLKVSADDEEAMFKVRMAEKKRFIKRINQFLVDADTDGNGVMDKQEMEDAIKNPRVTHFFKACGMELEEIEGLFDLLDDGDGLISREEFITGIERLKGEARAVDSVLIMHHQNAGHQQIKKDIQLLSDKISNVM